VSQSSSPEQVVRDVIAAADRRRRAQRAGRGLATIAPIAAAGLLAVAIAARLFSWPLAATVAVSALLVSTVGLGIAIARRSRPVTDTIAAGIDGDAGCGGELRSAYWFASAASLDDWTRFHLERAADHLAKVVWRDVYPPVPARRAWWLTAALVIAAFALPAGLPTWSTAPAEVSAAARADELAAEIDALPPELQQQILEILEKIQTRQITREEALAALRELPGFSKLDAELREQIENSLRDASAEPRSADKSSEPDLGAGQTSADVQWARENMASRMANEEAQKAEAGEKGAEGEQANQLGRMDQAALEEAGEASPGRSGMKVAAKDGMQTEGTTGMMLKNGETGDPGTAFGGKRGSVKYGSGNPSEIAAVLKREQIEASANLDNANLKNEDKRKKTEQGWSTLRYTRVTGLSTFDRARTDAPRAVPEARRPLLERYFVRPPDEMPAVPPSQADKR